MSFRKIFGSSLSSSDDKKRDNSSFLPDATNMSIDEQFIYNFKKNGGKFLYCIEEIKEQFENILQENDWYESTVLCYEPKLFNILKENKLSYEKSSNPKFLFQL
jgi:hypothetical protein